MLTTNGQTWVRYKKKNEEKIKREREERERNGVYVRIHIYIKYLSPSNQRDSVFVLRYGERTKRERERKRIILEIVVEATMFHAPRFRALSSLVAALPFVVLRPLVEYLERLAMKT